MYSFPSTSQIFAPAARSTKKGSPPTLRNARTGELTPPGMRFWAAAKSLDERVVMGRRKRPTLNAQRPTFNSELNPKSEIKNRKWGEAEEGGEAEEQSVSELRPCTLPPHLITEVIGQRAATRANIL